MGDLNKEEWLDFLEPLMNFNKLTQDLAVAALNNEKVISISLAFPMRRLSFYEYIVSMFNKLIEDGLVLSEDGEQTKRLITPDSILITPYISDIWSVLNALFADHYKYVKTRIPNSAYPASPWYSAYDYKARIMPAWSAMAIVTKCDILAEFIEQECDALYPKTRNRTADGTKRPDACFIEELDRLKEIRDDERPVINAQKDLYYIYEKKYKKESQRRKIISEQLRMLVDEKGSNEGARKNYPFLIKVLTSMDYDAGVVSSRKFARRIKSKHKSD